MNINFYLLLIVFIVIIFLFYLFFFSGKNKKVNSIYNYRLFNFKIRSISLSKKVLLAFLFVSILSSFIFASLAYFYEKQNIQQSINNEMGSLSLEKGSRLNDYLEDKKDDMKVLAKDIAIRNIFNKKIKEDINYAKNEIKNQARNTAKQIEDFLKKNPQMTIKDLQKNDEFQKIAVQSVGKTGYTALTDSRSLVCYFHKNSKIVNMDLSRLEKKLPDFWQIMKASRGRKVSDGFYDWLEEDGSIRKKYMYIDPVERSIGNGIYLSVAATTYIDEFNSSFQIIGEADNFLKQYVQEYNFENLFLIGIDDKIWWEAKESFKIGTDIFSLDEEKKNFISNYKKVKISGKAVVFNCGCKKNKTFKAFIAIPIRNHFTGDLIGVAIEQFSHKQFNNIINIDNDFIKDNFLYLVDSQRNVIESNKEDYILSDKINESINLKNCFAHRNLEDEKKAQEHKKAHYYNNGSEEVLGTYFYIKDLDWCLLLETPADKVMAPLFRLKSFFISVSILIILLSVLLSYLFSRMLIAPILKLTEGARRFMQNNFKYKVNINTRDELEVLGMAFNKVGDYLAKAKKKQIDYENRLEEEIDLKTSQLKEVVDSIKKDKDNLQNQQKAMLNILEDANEVQTNLKNSKEDLEENQKELELIISLSHRLSAANNLNNIADILYEHFLKIFEFSAMSFFVFSENGGKMEVFRVYCVKDMDSHFIIQLKKDIKLFLIKDFKLSKKQVNAFLSSAPKIFGRKPGRRKNQSNLYKNLFPF